MPALVPLACPATKAASHLTLRQLETWIKGLSMTSLHLHICKWGSMRTCLILPPSPPSPWPSSFSSLVQATSHQVCAWVPRHYQIGCRKIPVGKIAQQYLRGMRYNTHICNNSDAPQRLQSALHTLLTPSSQYQLMQMSCPDGCACSCLACA